MVLRSLSDEAIPTTTSLRESPKKKLVRAIVKILRVNDKRNENRQRVWARDINAGLSLMASTERTCELRVQFSFISWRIQKGKIAKNRYTLCGMAGSTATTKGIKKAEEKLAH